MESARSHNKDPNCMFMMPDVLQHPMGIQPHMFPSRVIVDIIISHSFEFGINSRREARLALHGAAEHWNDRQWRAPRGAPDSHGSINCDLDREGGFEGWEIRHCGGFVSFSPLTMGLDELSRCKGRDTIRAITKRKD